MSAGEHLLGMRYSSYDLSDSVQLVVFRILLRFCLLIARVFILLLSDIIAGSILLSVEVSAKRIRIWNKRSFVVWISAAVA